MLDALRRLRDAHRLRRRTVRRRSVGHTLVLSWHRIAAPPASDPWRMCVDPQRFDEQLAVLVRRAEVVPAAALDAPAPRTARPRVVLTFDDAYPDALRAALPTLERHGLPATFFVPPAAIEGGRPYWWDRLAAAVEGPRLVESYARLWTLPEPEREERLARIVAAAGDAQPSDELRPLDLAELRRLAASSRVEIGAHGDSHQHLPSLGATAQRADAERSRASLARLLGTAPRTFAYPYGAYDRGAVAAVRAAGFARAFTNEGELAWDDTDPLLTPRFAVGDWDAARFERALHEEWLP